MIHAMIVRFYMLAFHHGPTFCAFIAHLGHGHLGGFL